MAGLNSHIRILVLEISFDLEHCYSLKDKRRIRQSLIEKMKRRYNVSVIESDLQDDYRKLELAVTYVALNEGTAHEMVDKIHNFCLSQTVGAASRVDLFHEIL
ncbi:MAG: DUF503 domain-containing protein [Eubacteriales bacterium]|nr:DUF503 domain-containing protein [Eubacteriales bacterium]